ncbi:unnamed protein product [Clonostachys rosea f. rosea IK726]|uniref:Uncharacterized protein n=1 Tax=Clonostachys rosea f. rosea IK726 TaxID=1349383 RepID=A0ACA9T7I7_BIOOC|nr:unnamed protein product [Clonostachys rosea f. rosea IK726]
MQEPTPVAPVAPSTEEQYLYFAGLPSNPKLVARSNSLDIKFKRGNGGTIWGIKKYLYTASPTHPIASLWDGALRQEIINALDGLDWTAIDILKLGLDPSWDRPDEDPEKYHQYGIHDMHCEIKESDVTRSVSGPIKIATPPAPLLVSQSESPPDYHPNIYHRSMASESLGASIASFNATKEGSKGLYLGRKDTGAILMLTCRHVVFDQSHESNTLYEHDPDTTPRLVIQPGSTTLKTMLDASSSHIAFEQSEIAALKSTKTLLTEDKRKAYIEKYEIRMAFDNMWKEYLESMTRPESRIIGNILYSPQISSGTSPSGQARSRDWALIELHPGKHPSKLSELQNIVTLAESDTLLLRQITREEIPDFRFSLHMLLDPLRLNNVLSEHEIQHPTTLDKHGDPRLIVAKFGHTTDLTVGVSNPIKSVTREVITGKVVISEEWCIVGRKQDENKKGRLGFSAGGDSGSCIWDMSGRIAGILTGGPTNRGINDVTYATPIEWILDDIRVQAGFEVELV